MFKRNLLANDICSIITAGSLAKCSKIEYNGLIIEYTLKPDAVSSNFVVAQPEPQSHDPEIEEALDKQIRQEIEAATDLNTLMMTDPERYEQLIAQEEIDAR